MTEIRPGIYQIQLSIPDNPLGHASLYLVQGDNGYRLIDAGWPLRNHIELFAP